MKFYVSDGNSALREALNSVGKKERIVICGRPDEKELLQAHMGYMEQSVSEIIHDSTSVSAPAWFKKEKEELLGYFAEDGLDVTEVEGEWQGDLTEHSISMHRELSSGEPFKEVLLASLTVQSPWHIPAHFKYGNWNACPEPELQCAIWEYWFERYGAEIVSVSHDVIEAWVPRPPANKEDALALSWEQYIYCADIVDQGVGSLRSLASTLLHSNSWFFWWD